MKPELERIHADEPRELVHLHFEREVADGDAEAAHRRDGVRLV